MGSEAVREFPDVVIIVEAEDRTLVEVALFGATSQGDFRSEVSYVAVLALFSHFNLFKLI